MAMSKASSERHQRQHLHFDALVQLARQHRIAVAPELLARLVLLRVADEDVVTGHEDGVITLDLAESDDVRRPPRLRPGRRRATTPACSPRR